MQSLMCVKNHTPGNGAIFFNGHFTYPWSPRGRQSGRKVDKMGEIGASRSLVRAKVYKTGGRAPGRVPLTDYFKSPFAFLLMIEHTF